MRSHTFPRSSCLFQFVVLAGFFGLDVTIIITGLISRRMTHGVNAVSLSISPGFFGGS